MASRGRAALGVAAHGQNPCLRVSILGGLV
jgi:hypothetical protein